MLTEYNINGNAAAAFSVQERSFSVPVLEIQAGNIEESDIYGILEQTAAATGRYFGIPFSPSIVRKIVVGDNNIRSNKMKGIDFGTWDEVAGEITIFPNAIDLHGNSKKRPRHEGDLLLEQDSLFEILKHELGHAYQSQIFMQKLSSDTDKLNVAVTESSAELVRAIVNYGGDARDVSRAFIRFSSPYHLLFSEGYCYPDDITKLQDASILHFMLGEMDIVDLSKILRRFDNYSPYGESQSGGAGFNLSYAVRCFQHRYGYFSRYIAQIYDSLPSISQRSVEWYNSFVVK